MGFAPTRTAARTTALRDVGRERVGMDLLGSLDLASMAGWAYVAIFVVCVVDSFLPVVPAETLVITGGVLAADGDLSLVAVVVAAVVGTVTGDLTTHGMGRRGSSRLLRRWLHRDRERRAVVAAARAVDRHGPTMVVVGRFVPLGRTSVALVTGVVRFPLRQYVPAVVLGCAVWSVEAAGVGYVAGRLIEDLWLSLGLGLLVGAVLAVVGMLAGRLLPARRRPDGERAPLLAELGTSR